MTDPADPGGVEQFGAAYWDDRYQNGEGTGRHDPSPWLVAETGGLRPGRALDAGCGVGADARWLAAHGWQVTAIDISFTALEQGRRTAEAGGPALAERIEWVHGDLSEWEPGQSAFDLVSSHYVHVPGPQELLFRRLASWVAPGGTLLVVGHDGGHAHGRQARPPAARLDMGQILDGLSPGQWRILAAEPRAHTIGRPDDGGPVTLGDVVVHARRRAGTQP